MNHPDYDLMVQTERRKDEMAAAASYRLLKAAELNATSRQMHFISPNPLRPLAGLLAGGMAWLGGLLTAWSCRLQQYTAAPSLSASPEEQPCIG